MKMDGCKNMFLSRWTDVRSVSRRRRVSRAIVAALLAFCVSALFVGCLIIPVDYHATGSRRNITWAATNAVQTGLSTRENVLFALGEPDFVSEDGGRVGYFWSKVKLIWAIAGYGGGAGGEIVRHYLIEVSFDSSNRVCAIRGLDGWSDPLAGDSVGKESH